MKNKKVLKCESKEFAKDLILQIFVFIVLNSSLIFIITSMKSVFAYIFVIFFGVVFYFFAAFKFLYLLLIKDKLGFFRKEAFLSSFPFWIFSLYLTFSILASAKLSILLLKEVSGIMNFDPANTAAYFFVAIIFCFVVYFLFCFFEDLPRKMKLISKSENSILWELGNMLSISSANKADDEFLRRQNQKKERQKEHEKESEDLKQKKCKE